METQLARHALVLRAAFGVEGRVREVAGGWSARAFVVEAERPLFLKVYDMAQHSVRPWIERIDRYIEAQAWLARTPALGGRMAKPVRALDGRFKVVSGGAVYLASEYIPGTTPGYGNMTGAEICELAGILARLHEFGAEIPVDTSGLGEDIALPFCAQLDAYLERDGALFRGHAALLRRAVHETIRLRDEVRAGAGQIRLCHTDAHGGNVVQGERLALVDWEGLCLAPPEADLFLHAAGPHGAAFLGAYRAARPGFVPDSQLLRFYLMRRQIEDIWEFALRLLEDRPDERETAEIHTQIGIILDKIARLMNDRG